MKQIQVMTPTATETDAAITSCLAGLVRCGALDSTQLCELIANWREERDGIWKSPFLRGVAEHTRSYVDSLRFPTPEPVVGEFISPPAHTYEVKEAPNV